jgi:hypothetical protein
MHRKTFKNIIKITNAKRLITGSFYRSDLFKKNIWASDLFALLNNPNRVLKSQLQLAYGKYSDNFASPSLLLSALKANRSTLSLSSLAHYEESFF